MSTIKLLQGRMQSGRRVRIEIRDIGLQPPAALPTMRCRMMMEGDDGSVFELLSPSEMLSPLERFRDALTDLGENGVNVASLEVIDSSRGFEAVMKRSAMRALGMD